MMKLQIILLSLLVILMATAGCQKAEQEGPAAEPMDDMVSEGWVLEDVGFETPESVIHDLVGDVYYVSNLGGPQPLEKDGNGFISKVGTDGTLIELKWISGETDGVELHAPKGMATMGDRLLVSDIDVLRVFDIDTGTSVMNVPLPGATFANDVHAAKGIVYVTDTGADGPGAVYSVVLEGQDGPVVEVMIRDDALTNPNGIVEDHEFLYMVPYGGNGVFKIGMDGTYDVVAHAPMGGLDGLVMLPDGRLAFSSWEGKAVYVMDAEHNIKPLFEEMESPADIGYDGLRDLMLIPLFMLNKVVAMPVGVKC
jgi:hypothetical protein